MPDLTAKRTLVKSPPELWEELSEVQGLAKHLGAFGEIKITKLEPEHTVAWEGEHASGTVSIEPSGWGTKVTLHAELPEETAPEAEETPVAEEPEPVAEEPVAEEQADTDRVTEEREVFAEEPEVVAEDPEVVAEEREPVGAAPRKRGFWAWLFRSRTADAEPEPRPEVRGPEPEAVEAEPISEPAEPVAEEVEPVAEEPEPAVAQGVDPERARAILDDALDALGAAHHRPFSRG